jgi:hypothetical protein
MLRDELLQEVWKLPTIDVHSHLPRDGMAAESIDRLLFYHMILYPLRSAGADEAKLWAGRWGHEGASPPRDEWLRHWPGITNTGFGWILRTILRDLYEFDEPITEESLPRLEAAFEARALRDDWPRHVLEKANVARVCSSHLHVPPLKEGEYDGGIRFTVETTPSSGMTEPGSWRKRLQGMGKHLGRDVDSKQALYDAVDAFYGGRDWTDKRVLVAWVSSQADFMPVPDAEIDRLLADAAAGDEPDLAGRRKLEAAFLRAICEANRERIDVFQICFGVQFESQHRCHPISRAAPQFATTLGRLVGEFPDIHFNFLNGYEKAEPMLTALCIGYNNVSLSSFWWTGFFPEAMHTGWARRFDMVPTSNLCAFLSDGYCVDYIYGRLALTKRTIANVLAEKIERGFLTGNEALKAARNVLFETPRRLFLPDENISV